MRVTVGIQDTEKIIWDFESDCIPNVGELIFDKINRKHLKVVSRVFGVFNGTHIQAMDVSLWCKEVK